MHAMLISRGPSLASGATAGASHLAAANSNPMTIGAATPNDPNRQRRGSARDAGSGDDGSASPFYTLGCSPMSNFDAPFLPSGAAMAAAPRGAVETESAEGPWPPPAATDRERDDERLSVNSTVSSAQAASEEAAVGDSCHAQAPAALVTQLQGRLAVTPATATASVAAAGPHPVSNGARAEMPDNDVVAKPRTAHLQPTPAEDGAPSMSHAKSHRRSNPDAPADEFDFRHGAAKTILPPDPSQPKHINITTNGTPAAAAAAASSRGTSTVSVVSNFTPAELHPGHEGAPSGKKSISGSGGERCAAPEQPFFKAASAPPEPQAAGRSRLGMRASEGLVSSVGSARLHGSVWTYLRHPSVSLSGAIPKARCRAPLSPSHSAQSDCQPVGQLELQRHHSRQQQQQPQQQRQQQEQTQQRQQHEQTQQRQQHEQTQQRHQMHPLQPRRSKLGNPSPSPAALRPYCAASGSSVAGGSSSAAMGSGLGSRITRRATTSGVESDSCRKRPGGIPVTDSGADTLKETVRANGSGGDVGTRSSAPMPRMTVTQQAALTESALLQPVPLSELRQGGLQRASSVVKDLQKPELRKLRVGSMDWVYGLTGRAGSCMYMAPEVYCSLPYNEKADVFSFGVLMYELLARELLLVAYFNTRRGARLGLRTPEDYAAKVCEGYRPPRSSVISDAAWSLIEACWRDDPVQRPTMEAVLMTLSQLRDAEEAEGTSDPRRLAACCTSGCVVM